MRTHKHIYLHAYIRIIHACIYRLPLASHIYTRTYTPSKNCHAAEYTIIVMHTHAQRPACAHPPMQRHSRQGPRINRHRTDETTHIATLTN